MRSAMNDTQPRGTIRIGEQEVFSHHRSGWAIAIDALRPEHSDAGILFDGFLDRTFSQEMNPRYQQDLPFACPWTGFFHNPHSLPEWFPDGPKIERMLVADKFRQSLPHCVGLFTLSNDLAQFLRARVGVAVSALVHPTEIPPARFDFDSFLANDGKKVISIGWWLRRTLSILYLPLDAMSPYRKVRLKLGDPLLDNTRNGLSRLEFVHEWRNRKLDSRYRDNTAESDYLPPAQYDDWLTRNIVFLDLLGASANNAVIECIARGTPLLVNPLPSVVEYLGGDYPFYFHSLKEAADKACQFDLVVKAHRHLMANPLRQQLAPDAFLQSFRQSVVYQHIVERRLNEK
jgi:hypothetical protein